MRDLYLVLLTILIISCSQKKEDTTLRRLYDGNQIDSIRRENLKSPVSDSIILGFKFNMSKQDYDYNFSRLVRNKTLMRYSKTEYSYPISDTLISDSVDGILIPLFEDNKLIALKMLAHGTTNATFGSIALKRYLTRQYGKGYISGRSISDLWIKGGLEIEVSRQTVKTDPNMSALTYDIVTYRQTALSLLAKL